MTKSPSCEPGMLIYQDGTFLHRNADGETHRFITDDTLNERIGNFSPVIFPAPSMTLFAVILVQDDNTEQIALLDAQGQLQSTLATCMDACRTVIWSPDEQSIIYVDFTDYPDYNWRVYQVDLSYPTPTLLLETQTFGDGIFSNGMWSPDGRFFAYELLQPMIQRSVYLYDVEADSHRLLLDPQPGKADGLLGWSPDGAHILLWSNRELGGIFHIAPDGLAGLTHVSELYALELHWSPDNMQAVFYSYEMANINILDYATSQVTAVTPPLSVVIEGDARPRWSLDAETILFHNTNDDSGWYYLFSVRPDGTDHRLLLDVAAIFRSWILCGN